MFEAARAAGATLGAHNLLPDAALQDAAIPAPLMWQKPQASAAGHLYLFRPMQGSLIYMSYVISHDNTLAMTVLALLHQ